MEESRLEIASQVHQVIEHHLIFILRRRFWVKFVWITQHMPAPNPDIVENLQQDFMLVRLERQQITLISVLQFTCANQIRGLFLQFLAVFSQRFVEQLFPFN